MADGNLQHKFNLASQTHLVSDTTLVNVAATTSAESSVRLNTAMETLSLTAS